MPEEQKGQWTTDCMKRPWRGVAESEVMPASGGLGNRGQKSGPHHLYSKIMETAHSPNCNSESVDLQMQTHTSYPDYCMYLNGDLGEMLIAISCRGRVCLFYILFGLTKHPVTECPSAWGTHFHLLRLFLATDSPSYPWIPHQWNCNQPWIANKQKENCFSLSITDCSPCYYSPNNTL